MLARLRQLADRLIGASSDPRRDVIAPCRWCLDLAWTEGNSLHAAGWAIRIGLADAQRPVGFTLNGRMFDEQNVRRESPDLIALFPFAPDAGRSRFVASTTLTPAERAGDVLLEVQCVDPVTGQAFREQQVAYVPLDDLERWPVPDGDRMKRVHGDANERAFRVMGYSTSMKLDRALQHVVRRPLRDFPRILDWGVGCGRVMRYLDRTGASLTGVDIDADNIDWCRRHLPFAQFAAIPTHPPTTLPADAFDLVFGISVFTHLTEPVQREWLGELRRIAAPDGVLLMSVHGPTVTASSGNLQLWQRVQQSGFIDSANPDLDAVLSDRSYYRNTFHTHPYILRVWGEFFQILDIIPAYIGNAQDLVVMRKTAGQ